MSVIGHLFSPFDLLDPTTIAHLDDDAAALDPVAILDLDRLEELTPDELSRMRAGHFSFRRIPIGVRTRPLSPTDVGPGRLLLERMATTLVPDADGQPPSRGGYGDRHAQGVTTVRVADPVAVAETIRRNVSANPTAALTLDTLLRITVTSSAREGLIAESFAHAMLLAGRDHRRWSKETPAPAEHTGPSSVRIERLGDVVDIRLSSEVGRRGLDFAARARLAQAFHELGPDVEAIRISADGPDFWGLARPDDVRAPEDIASTHVRRMAANLGVAVYPHRRHLSVHVTGRCEGVGVELAALAQRVTASPDAVFELPQLRMGLITGSGGTVALTRRLGRWRAAYLALWAGPIDAATAYQWHLIDDIVDEPSR